MLYEVPDRCEEQEGLLFNQELDSAQIASEWRKTDGSEIWGILRLFFGGRRTA